MKKWGLVLVVFLNCFFVKSEGVFAKCTGVVEIFPVREMNDDGNYKTTGRISGNTYNLETDESVCGVEQDGDNKLRVVLQICKDDGTVDQNFCEGLDSICNSYKNNGKINGHCRNDGGCVYTGSKTYLGYDSTAFGAVQNDYYSYMSDDDLYFTKEGAKGCFNNVIKRCIPQTGTWETVEDCGSKYCQVFSVNKGYKWDAECNPGCSNPSGGYGEAKCSSNGGVVECDFNGEWDSQTLSKYFNDDKCISCKETISGPSCIKLENGVYTKFCTVIQGDSEPVNAGKEGDFICNRAGTVLYKCDITSSNYKKNGAYSTAENCSSKNLVCGAGDDGKAACITKDEAGRNDQSVVRSTVDISISTDTGFMCDVNSSINSDSEGGSGDDNDGVSTAFGCIPITASGLANKLLPILFGIAGGISFLRMVLGFIMIATSSGDEKKFIEAKSIISSAIIGLLVSIFAIFLFRLIFVNILQIPGLS